MIARMDEAQDPGSDENLEEGQREEPRSRINFCPICRHDHPGHDPHCPYADPAEDPSAT